MVYTVREYIEPQLFFDSLSLQPQVELNPYHKPSRDDLAIQAPFCRLMSSLFVILICINQDCEIVVRNLPVSLGSREATLIPSRLEPAYSSTTLHPLSVATGNIIA